MPATWKRLSRALLSALLVLVFASCKKEPEVKYVFYLIGDGMGINHVFGAQEYNRATGTGPQVINFTRFPVHNFITTPSSSSLITDSAAGGTALSSGIKTYNSAVGVDADTVAVTSLTDWAAAAGYGTGLCTNVGLNHATPACFMAHTPKRKNYKEIALQYLTAPVDFAGAAGVIRRDKRTRKRLPDTAFLEKAREAGISVFRGPSFEGLAETEGRVLCLSGKDEIELPYAIDRKEDDTRLCDFVRAGIDYLYSRFGRKGFFFMIEGGKIDYAGHGDDMAACIQEVNDFAYAIDLVLDFWKAHPDETLIVITADHETGGLMLGSGDYKMDPERLMNQKMSKLALTEQFRNTFYVEGEAQAAPSWQQVRDFFRKHLGLWDKVEVSAEAEAGLRAVYDRTVSHGWDLSDENLYSEYSALVVEAVDILTRAAGYQWSYESHSGSPVGLYVQGKCWERFATVQDNTEIAPLIAELAGYQR